MSAEATPKRTQTCRICGEPMNGASIKSHYFAKHPEAVKRTSKQPPAPSDPSVVFQNIRNQAKLMMQQIDDERNRIQKRLLELDSMAAKFKSLV